MGSMKERNKALKETLEILNRIYTEDSNSILSADVNGRHPGNPMAVYAELVGVLLLTCQD